jgi:hypothetical protein
MHSYTLYYWFFEIKFEITVFKKEVSRKAVSRFEKSVFEINDFSPKKSYEMEIYTEKVKKTTKKNI